MIAGIPIEQYEPRVRDEIRVRTTYTGVVREVTQDHIWFADTNLGLSRHEAAGARVTVELLSHGFVVGELLTAERGEPPIGSVARHASSGRVYTRGSDDRWRTACEASADRPCPMPAIARVEAVCEHGHHEQRPMCHEHLGALYAHQSVCRECLAELRDCRQDPVTVASLVWAPLSAQVDR